jgi:hypothetical protein
MIIEKRQVKLEDVLPEVSHNKQRKNSAVTKTS